MGALDAMGWKTNSQAWLAKYYEKVLSMIETLSRLLEGQGDQFRVEGCKRQIKVCTLSLGRVRLRVQHIKGFAIKDCMKTIKVAH
jgi:hypothetical protein